MRTLRLVIEYDGTHFAGWQSQKSDRTVQDALEQALHILLKEPVRLIGAGRTDAGTHALGQVAHFQTETALPPDRLLRNLNGLLPPDIAVRTADEVAEDFHARYSATRKRYRYPHSPRQGGRQSHSGVDLLLSAFFGPHDRGRPLTLRRTLFWGFLQTRPHPQAPDLPRL